MKRTILIVIVFSLAVFSCNDHAAFKASPPDTLRTLGVYFNPLTKMKEYGIIFNVEKDSFMFVDVDTLTKKKKWTRNPFYYVPVFDTMRGSDGKPLLDSLTKNPRLERRYVGVLNDIVLWDSRFDLDSLERSLPDSVLIKKYFPSPIAK